MIITLVAYQIVLLGLGYWARRRSQSSEGYFIGGRALGPWVTALSYAAGSSSAWSILGVSGIAFSQGLSALWLLPGTLTGHVIVWFWIAPHLQRLSHQHRWITLTDMLASGLPTAVARLTYRISAVVILFSFTFYIAAQFQGAANTFTAVFDFSFAAALLLGAGVVLLYTLWGGFWAVSVTDALQAVLMLLAAIVLPWVALQAVGGWQGLSDAANQAIVASEIDYWSMLGGHGGWFAVGFLLGMLSIGFGPLGQPHLLNRLMAMRRAQDVRLARTVALTWFVLVLSGMFLLGVCGHLLVQSPVAAEQVFFVLAADLLPVAVTGILVAAVLSAIMSTADSQLLVAGAAIHNDLRRHTGPADLSARVAVLAVAIAAVLLALYLPEAIFSRVLFAWNALGAAFGPVVVTRLLGWRFTGWSVPVSIGTGFGLTVVFYGLADGPGDVWERAVPFLVALLVLTVGREAAQSGKHKRA
ncbi:MAG: sodium/proline symporter [Pseudomonadota bacterium]